MDADLLARTADEIDRLWRSARPSSAGLRQLARTLLTRAQEADSPGDILRPCEFAAGTRDEVLARSLAAAQATAWMTVHFASVQPRAEWLVAAALIADAGRLRPKRAIRLADDPSHPNLAASLAAGLVESPSTLPRLVGRHHERSDGTGFPLALTAARLTGDERLVIAAVGFAELFAGDTAEAARRLHEEARCGAFDAELTANLVWSVTGELPADAGFDRPAPRPWGLTDRGRRLRLDPAHPALEGPHFAVRSPAAGPERVRSETASSYRR
jgi:hypothetical protein